jgi:hypothetical protein
MRLPKALSYSSLSLLEKQPEEFYMKHLSEVRAAREPQTPAMAVGSAFDAYAKAALHAAVFGPGADPEYEFTAIYDSQVEPQNRDFGLKAGMHAFLAYKFCGAFQDLLDQLLQSVEPPRFEFTLNSDIGEVPFTGKPDCRFVLDLGEGNLHCVYDWKVRGFCSKYTTSPSKGYAICLDCFKAAKSSRSHGREHGKYLAKPFRGMAINAGYMETCAPNYADQLCLYGWLLGEEVGDESVVLGIEELVSKPMGEGNLPQLRYARHRALCKSEYQHALFERVQNAWQRITGGHFFPDLSLEESEARCQQLEEMAVSLAQDDSDLDQWFNDATRDPYRG